MAKRGELTPEIQELAKKFWGREITWIELRLYPYIYYCAINDRKIKAEKVNSEERAIMKLWKDAGHFSSALFGMNMTKEFFDFMNEIQWLAYFTYDEE